MLDEAQLAVKHTQSIIPSPVNWLVKVWCDQTMSKQKQIVKLVYSVFIPPLIFCTIVHRSTSHSRSKWICVYSWYSFYCFSPVLAFPSSNNSDVLGLFLLSDILTLSG